MSQNYGISVKGGDAVSYTHLIVMMALLGGTFASCESWFDIRPKSETVFEDFWKDENDVLSMVGSCYRGMNETGFIERAIVWGELRSDNVKAGTCKSDPDVYKRQLTFFPSKRFSPFLVPNHIKPLPS